MPVRAATFQGLTTDAEGRPRFTRTASATASPASPLSPKSTVGSSLFDDSEPPPLSLDEDELTLEGPACPLPGASRAGDLAADGQRKLRIAIITENFLPKVDGVTRTLCFLLDYLESQGHEVLIIGPGQDDRYSSFPHLRTPGLPLSSLGVYGDGLGLNFFAPSFVPRLMKFRPDVLHFVDPIWLGTQGLPITEAWLANVAKVGSYHTNLATYGELFGFGWIGLPNIMWALQRHLHSRLLLTFVPSPSTSTMLVSHGFRSERLRLWPRGVDTSFFSPAKRDVGLRRRWLRLAGNATDVEGGTVLLYVGRVSWEKNLRLLVESFREVVQRPEGARLVIVGDGPAKQDMQALCGEYGLAERIVFEGHRKGEELARMFASADIFTFPSWTETFGQVVIEAQASGLPVVGLRAEGVRDLVEHDHTGLLLDMDALVPSPAPFASHPASPPLPRHPHKLFAPGTPSFSVAVQRYAALILSLCSSGARPARREMSCRAVEVAEKHSWTEAMTTITSGYREAVRMQHDRVRAARERQLARERVGRSVFGKCWPKVPPQAEGAAGSPEPVGTTTAMQQRATPSSLIAADKASTVSPEQDERPVVSRVHPPQIRMRNRILRQAILRTGAGFVTKAVILTMMLATWLSWLFATS